MTVKRTGRMLPLVSLVWCILLWACCSNSCLSSASIVDSMPLHESETWATLTDSLHNEIERMEVSDEDAMHVLLELHEHMDVREVLLLEEHQEMFAPKPSAKATASAPAASASPSKGGKRQPAAARLTPAVHAAKFARFTAAQKRKYATPAAAAEAFSTFKANRETIVALNDKADPDGTGKPLFTSSGPLADVAKSKFVRVHTNAKNPKGNSRGRSVKIPKKTTKQPSQADIDASHKNAAARVAKGAKTAPAPATTASVASPTSSGAGHGAGMSGKTGGQSGKTGGQSGKTGGQSGKTGGQSGKTGGQSGKTGGQSGKTGGQSGKTGGQSGKTGGKSGKTGAQGGTDATKSGKSGGSKSWDVLGVHQRGVNLTLSTAKNVDVSVKGQNASALAAESHRMMSLYSGIPAKQLDAIYADKGELSTSFRMILGKEIEQPGDCGSCWAFVARDAMQWLYNYIGGPAQTWDFSAQQLVDCVKTADTNGCSGGSPMDALDWWFKNPVATVQEYPVTGKQGTCQKGKFAGKAEYQYRTGVMHDFLVSYGWFMIVPPCTDAHGPCYSQITYELDLMRYMSKRLTAPIIYLDATNLQHYSGGLFNTDFCKSTMDAGNHIMQLMGYQWDANMGPVWVLRNTWGSNWGDSGKLYLPFGKNACGVMNYILQAVNPQFDNVDDGSSERHLTAQAVIDRLKTGTNGNTKMKLSADQQVAPLGTIDPNAQGKAVTADEMYQRLVASGAIKPNAQPTTAGSTTTPPAQKSPSPSQPKSQPATPAPASKSSSSEPKSYTAAEMYQHLVDTGMIKPKTS